MGLAALAGALWLVTTLLPTLPNLLLFLALLLLAVTGLLTPLLAWLHGWLPIGGRPPTPAAARRQAFLIGLAVTGAAILHLLDLLDGALVFALVALVILVELLAQSRAR